MPEGGQVNETPGAGRFNDLVPHRQAARHDSGYIERPMRRLLAMLALLLIVSTAADHACADALVVTRAMRAETICEIRVEEGRIRTELEIGARDLPAFRNLLPEDLLAKLGVEGDLLTRTYLETKRALVLENQGGARARVQEVVVESAQTSAPEEGEGFKARCTWTVAGAVGHWGHIHQRRNRYTADVTVRPIDGTWRITGLELLNEERL